MRAFQQVDRSMAVPAPRAVPTLLDRLQTTVGNVGTGQLLRRAAVQPGGGRVVVQRQSVAGGLPNPFLAAAGRRFAAQFPDADARRAVAGCLLDEDVPLPAVIEALDDLQPGYACGEADLTAATVDALYRRAVAAGRLREGAIVLSAFDGVARTGYWSEFVRLLELMPACESVSSGAPAVPPGARSLELCGAALSDPATVRRLLAEVRPDQPAVRAWCPHRAPSAGVAGSVRAPSGPSAGVDGPVGAHPGGAVSVRAPSGLSNGAASTAEPVRASSGPSSGAAEAAARRILARLSEAGRAAVWTAVGCVGDTDLVPLLAEQSRRAASDQATVEGLLYRLAYGGADDRRAAWVLAAEWLALPVTDRVRAMVERAEAIRGASLDRMRAALLGERVEEFLAP